MSDHDDLAALCANGGNVKLTRDYAPSPRVDISNVDISIDLNGHTLTGADNDDSFVTGNGHSCTIFNGKTLGGLLYINGAAKVILHDLDASQFDNASEKGAGKGWVGGAGATLLAGSQFINLNIHDSHAGRPFYVMVIHGTPDAHVIWRYITFNNTFNAIKWNSGTSGTDPQDTYIDIDHCLFTAQSYHPIEGQSSGEYINIEDNDILDQTAWGGDWSSHFGMSVIGTGPSHDWSVQRNRIIMPNGGSTPPPKSCPLGIEGPAKSKITDNYIENCWTGWTPWGGNDGSVNRVVNFHQDACHSEGGGSITNGNNGPNAPLTWDINRPRTGYGTGGGTIPPTNPSNMQITLTSASTTTLDATWPAVDKATQYVVYIKTTGGSDAKKKLGAVTGPGCHIAGLHPAWEYTVSVNALDATGATLASGTANFRVKGTIDGTGDDGSANGKPPLDTSIATVAEAGTGPVDPLPPAPFDVIATLRLTIDPNTKKATAVSLITP